MVHAQILIHHILSHLSFNYNPYFNLQNVYAPDPDPNVTVTCYQRTAEQNEQLGLNDMKTKNYGRDDQQ